MKKLVLSIVAAAMVCLSANAQEYEFVPGWFVGAQGGAQYTVGEAAFKDLISPTASLNVGYQFKDWFGVRANINAWQGKGKVYFSGQGEGYKYNYGQLGFDAVFNLADFGKNYRPKTVNPYAFLGLGVMAGVNNNEMKDLLAAYANTEVATKYWDAPTWSALGRAGLGVDFRLSHRVLLGVEVAANAFSDKMNSKKGDNKFLGIVELDYNISAQIGVKVALGKTYKTRADEVAAAAAAAAAAAEAERLAAAERAAAEKAAAEKAAAEAAAAKAAADAAAAKAAAEAAEFAKDLCLENVLFDLNKSNIRKSENDKIKAVVECLNANPDAKVKISGHADKETGNPKLNKDLSQKRAENVAKAIKAAGIPEDRIIVESFGDTANPYSEPEANRVAICVANRTF